MRAIYVANTEGVVALAAVTVAKTIFGVKADSGHAIDLLGLAFSLDGTTVGDKDVLVELCAVTFATNAPGTNSTVGSLGSAGVVQEAGPRIAETFSMAKNWTTEPTVVTPIRPLDVDPYKFAYDSREDPMMSPDFNLAEGFAIRATVPTGGGTGNMRVWARWARV